MAQLHVILIKPQNCNFRIVNFFGRQTTTPKIGNRMRNGPFIFDIYLILLCFFLSLFSELHLAIALYPKYSTTF